MSKTIQTWSQEIRPGDKLPEGYDFASMMEDHYEFVPLNVII